jgi:hypothetical protein
LRQLVEIEEPSFLIRVGIRLARDEQFGQNLD